MMIVIPDDQEQASKLASESDTKVGLDVGPDEVVPHPPFPPFLRH